jgi:cytochrome P450
MRSSGGPGAHALQGSAVLPGGLGAPLARLEASVALPALFGRFPTMQLAADPGDLGHLPSLVMNGHSTLPVDLRPCGTGQA